MPNWKKVILSGSDAALNNITASGDVSASNFIGLATSASHAVNVKVTELNTPGNFPIIYNTGDDLLKSDPGTQAFTFNAGTGNVTAATFTGTSSHAAFAESSSHTTFAETIDIVNTPTNASVHSVLFALNDSVKTDSTAFTYQPSTDKLSIINIDATDVTGSNFVGETIRIRHQNGYDFLDVGSLVGGGYLIAGDPNSNDNGTVFEVNDEDREITLKFDESATHLFSPTGLTITGSITTTGSIKATNNISASGNLYGSNLIFPDTNSKITTPSGLVTDDYLQIVSNGSNQHFTVVLDGSDFFKADFTNELITLNESTQIGAVSSDTHTFTGTIIANQAISASNSISSSTYYGDGSNLTGIDPFPYTGSAAISGTLSLDGEAGHITASGNISASGNLTITEITASGKISSSKLIHGNYLKSTYDITLGESSDQGTITFGNGSGAVLEQENASTFKITEGNIRLAGSTTVTSNLTVGGSSLLHSTAGNTKPIYRFLWNDHATSVSDVEIHHPSSSIGLIQFGERAFDSSGPNSVTTVTQSAAIEIFRTQERRTGGSTGGSPDVNFTYNAFGTEMHFRVMPSSSAGNVFEDVSDMTTALKLNAETGAHVKNLRTPAITFTPTSSLETPEDNVIIFPQSGNMNPDGIQDLATPIGVNLKYGEVEKGSIIISSSFGGTETNANQDVAIGLFKTPIKNSKVEYDFYIEVYNKDNEVFATNRLHNTFIWYSGSVLTIDYTNATYATTNYNFDDELVFHINKQNEDDMWIPRMGYDHNPTSGYWDSNSYFYWKDVNTSPAGYAYLWDIGRKNGTRWRAMGPKTYNGEEYITAYWDYNRVGGGGFNALLGGQQGFRNLQFIIHIDYTITNNRRS